MHQVEFPDDEIVPQRTIQKYIHKKLGGIFLYELGGPYM